jgi:hypothetical protein
MADFLADKGMWDEKAFGQHGTRSNSFENGDLFTLQYPRAKGKTALLRPLRNRRTIGTEKIVQLIREDIRHTKDG